MPVLLYGLDTLTLTDKFLHKVDAAYYRLLRRCIGIKASYYSRISNLEVWKQAGEPTPPSKTLNAKQKDFLGTVFAAKPTNPIHNIVFCSAFKDRIISQGRCRGRKCPYWLEVVTSRHYPNIWNHHNALFGVHFKYVTLSRLLRGAPEKAPKRAHRSCARPWQKKPLKSMDTFVRFAFATPRTTSALFALAFAKLVSLPRFLCLFHLLLRSQREANKVPLGRPSLKGTEARFDFDFSLANASQINRNTPKARTNARRASRKIQISLSHKPGTVETVRFPRKMLPGAHCHPTSS